MGASAVRPVSNVLPEGYALSANYPNPFNPSTTITFSVPEKEFVSIKVYDLLGREVSDLVGAELTPGSCEVEFDATGLPSGMYIYRMSAGVCLQTRKMNLVK